MNIAVIGGGASGMMASIAASEKQNNVYLFEKKDRVGKKILSTGNGKCNFTNAVLASDKYYCEDASYVERIFDKFDNNDLISFFNSIGMISKEKNGYLYPLSEQASTVLDVLREELSFLNVNVLTDFSILKIERKDNGFILFSGDGKFPVVFDKVIMACGGLSGLGKNENNNAYDILKNLGHTITPLYPALTQIICKGLNFVSLKGVRTEAVLNVFADNEFIIKANGEVLFTDYGLSGIVSFQISHLVKAMLLLGKKVEVCCDLMPDISKEDLKAFLISKKLLNHGKDLQSLMTGVLNKKLNIEIIKLCLLMPSMSVEQLTDDDFDRLAENIKNMPVICKDVNSFNDSQVTAGGVKLSEVDDNCMSKIVEGLYIVGELLDVDGLCGGYNLQWAFSTGHIAGEHACS